METKLTGKREYYLHHHGNGGPVIIRPMFARTENESEEFFSELISALGDREFTLADVPVEDWNRDLSPWSAPGATDDYSFGGNGRETFDFIVNDLIPDLESKPGDRRFYIAGYSLAGLFALWSVFECSCFSGAACCSGTLWFQGFEEFAEAEELKGKCNIYLSLGGKEEMTKNPLMSTIGERTRRMKTILESKENVTAVTLEMNKGGHFTMPLKRVAKGVAWLLEQEDKNVSHS